MIMKTNYILLLVSVILSFSSLSKAQYSVCSYLEKDIDYKGNDLTYTYSASTPQLCADLCSSLNKICKGFTFWYMSSYNVCFLKNFTSTPTRYPSPGRYSCVMVNAQTTTTTQKILTTTTTLKPVTTVSTVSTLTTSTSTSSKPLTTTTTTTIKPVTTLSTVSTTTATTTTTKPITVTVTTTTSTTTKPTTTSTLTTTSASGPTTIPQPKCFSETDAFFGFSDSSDMISANSVGECCNACESYGSKCLAFSFLVDQSVCYIYYDNLQEKVFRTDAISGFINPDYSTASTPSVTTSPTTTVSTSTNQPKCYIETDAFFGFSDSSDFYSAKNEGECCDYCRSDKERCIAFSYLSDQQVCYTYYDFLPEKVYRLDAVSGAINPNV